MPASTYILEEGPGLADTKATMLNELEEIIRIRNETIVNHVISLFLMICHLLELHKYHTVIYTFRIKNQNNGCVFGLEINVTCDITKLAIRTVTANN